MLKLEQKVSRQSTVNCFFFFFGGVVSIRSHLLFANTSHQPPVTNRSQLKYCVLDWVFVQVKKRSHEFVHCHYGEIIVKGLSSNTFLHELNSIADGL